MAESIDWLLVMTNLASGAWTWAEAEAYTGMPRAAIEAAIHAARTGGSPWGPRHADLAVRVITRYGLRSGAALLSWPALLAVLAILAAISGGAYMYSNWGKPSAEPVAPGPAMTRPRPTTRPTAEPAPPAETAATNCCNCCEWEVEGEPRCVEGAYKIGCESNERYPGKFFPNGRCVGEPSGGAAARCR
jgi:hypothetical protein